MALGVVARRNLELLRLDQFLPILLNHNGTFRSVFERPFRPNRVGVSTYSYW